MKIQKGFREQDHADELRKAKRLEPMQKSGKERHAMYSRLNDEEEDEPMPSSHRESILDYLDDDET